MYKGDESMILNYVLILIQFLYIPLTAVLLFLELLKSLYPEQWDHLYRRNR